MRNDQQFEQLIMQYKQLINGAEDIYGMISNEDFDSAMTMLKSRESVYLNCKCMRKYLDLTDEQEKELNAVLEDLKTLEKRNIESLVNMKALAENELKNSQKTEKIQHAYDFDENHVGTIINLEE